VPVYHTEGIAKTLYLLKDSGSRFPFIWSPRVAAEIVRHLDTVAELEALILLRGTLDIPELSCLTILSTGTNISIRCWRSGAATRRARPGLDCLHLRNHGAAQGGPTLTPRHFLSNVAACVAFFPLGAPGTFRGWSKQ